jgi:hypothetical protein
MKKSIIFIFLMFLAFLATSHAASAENLYPTPEGFNDNDYQKLVAFALQVDNLQKLGWDLNDPHTWGTVFEATETYGNPGQWSGPIYWINNGTEYRVRIIDFSAINYEYYFGYDKILNLTGNLDVSDFTSLRALLVCGNYLTGINVSGCEALDLEWFSFTPQINGKFIMITSIEENPVTGTAPFNIPVVIYFIMSFILCIKSSRRFNKPS